MRADRFALPLAWAAWLVFFGAFGFQAYAYREDGYLLTLAERLTRGDVPYRDFSYIRPPLPIAIQAALLRLVPGYAIPESRWYFAVQAAGVMAVVYMLLGRFGWTRPARAAAALLAVACAFTGGFPPMPWHTVDGIFFSSLAVWALVAARERGAPGLAALAGLAAGAAALSKQGFVLVAAVGFALTLTPAGRASGRRAWSLAAAYGAGAALIAVATVGYLAAYGALGAAVESVLMAPGEITRTVLHRTPWDLSLRMHLPSPTGAALGLALLVLVRLRMPDTARLGLAAVLLGLVAVGWWAWRSPGLLHSLFLVEPLYTAAWVGGLGLLGLAVAGRGTPSPSTVWALALSLCTLYATTWSYLGIGMARIGLVLGLPLVLAALAADVHGPRRAARGVLLYAGLLAAAIWVAVPHLDASRDGLTEPFRADRLRGIRSSPSRVRSVDGAVELVRRETAAGDYVLAFMDFPALYFLTERRNPTRVDWYLPQEVTSGEVARAVADLTARAPRLVVLNALDPIEMGHPRLRPVLEYLVARYEDAGPIGEFRIMRPRP